MKPLIKITKLNKSYNGEAVLSHFNLEIFSRDRLVIMGPSGAGKSTLLNLIGQLEVPDSGMIEYHPSVFEGTQVPFPFVFQESDVLLPWKTVRENILLVNPKISSEAISTAIQTVELEGHTHKYPHELSGGMKQRVGIARALVCQSKVLLLDEPFANLDRSMRHKLQDFIIELQMKTQLTLVIVTHDDEEAKRIGTRTVYLNT